ncbi:MAG TPA: pyridoxal phosphate-dependent aminotransferase [Euryarchaeota archaeon]|nr:aspartate aminotransferase [archaeon BMS3Bbin15]HDL14590.1 pyridoxal phosphate-dependent aminotransferase [Euryarchaeota archaeon]
MLAERIKAVRPSVTLEITAKAKALRGQGRDIIGFGAGEPDFDTPEHIKKAAYRAIDEGFVYYTPTAGILELREAIAEKLNVENKIRCSAENIIVTPGAKQALYEAIMVLVNPGEEVLIPSPYWVSYLPMVQLASGKPVFIPTGIDGRFKLGAEQILERITDKTKLLILNSPCNPTGAVLSREDIRAIADVCRDKSIQIISDEIYEYIIYNGREHVSIGSFPDVEDLTITVNGFSKAYSMTGWRLGYASAREDILKAMQRLQAHSVSHPTSFVQKAGVVALTSPESKAQIEKMVRAFDERRKVITEKLREIPGVKCSKPDGAFYVFANFSAYEEDSFRLAEYLLEKAGVACVPGEAFGEEGRGYLRLSYALSMEKINEGVERIKKALKNYEVNR